MLRTVNAQPTLWESLLPKMCLGLPAELEAVDRLLDDPVFFAPYRRHFHPIFGLIRFDGQVSSVDHAA